MKNKRIFTLTFLSLFILMGFNNYSIDTQAASSGYFVEEFDNTNYMDSSKSNVSRWGAGQIELPRKNPLYQDLLKVSTTGNSITVDGNYAYVGGAYDGLYILDVTSPDAMSLEGYYNDSAEIDWIYGCEIYSNKAYLANGNDGLLILDVTNKAAPTKLGEIDLYHGLDVEVLVTHAYVACYTGGIRAIDVSTPSVPVDVGGYIPVSSGDANGLAISNDLLFVAVASGGLDVYNISTLSSPVFISNIDLDGYAKKVEVKDNYAYVACDLGGLQIVDFSDPTNMTRVAWVGDNTRYHGVDIQDNYVFVTGKSGMSDYMLHIYSIADPADPIPAGVYLLPYTGQDVFVSGNYAYVMASTSGVLSLQIADTGGYFGNFYASYAEAVSTGCYYAPAGEVIDRAMVSGSDLDGPQATISYSLSANGGVHWESIDVGVMHYFTNTGQSLKWKAELATTNDGITPVVYSIGIDYFTEDVGIDLLYPGDSSYILDQTPNLDWNDIPGAMGYLLQVDDSTSFHDLLVNESLIMHESNYTLPTPLDFGGSYFWRVAYYIDFDTISVFSAYSTFTIDDEPVVSEFGIVSTVLTLVSCIAISSALIISKRRKV